MDPTAIRRNVYAERYKRRMDSEVKRLFSSLSHSSLPPAGQTYQKLPIFAVRRDISAWERVKTAAKRSVWMSFEPVNHAEMSLRARVKGLELHPPMHFPSPKDPVPSFSAANIQKTERIGTFKPIKAKKAVHFAKLQSKPRSKSHMKALLSLKLGFSVGGSDRSGLFSPKKRESLLAQLPSHRRWQSLQG